MVNHVELLLSRHADSAWRAAIRPWLEAGRGRLERAYVIAGSRGQAQGLKQRCLTENVPLLGVEFLTPGLARKKWIALRPDPRPAMGRELLLLGLRSLIARRLALLQSSAPAWGFWKSLQSDPERALDDFDELLKVGFDAVDFPLPPLREIFGELSAWVEARGYILASLEAKRAGAEPLGEEARAIGGRVLVYGLGAEMWGEFFNVAAFVRRCADVTAVLPEPEFRGRAGHDERWVELWSRLLGTDPLPIDADEPAQSCEPVGALWLREAGAADQARMIVGRTRGDEMHLVAAEITRLLAAGAENIAVIFPRSDPAHLRLAQLLTAAGILFTDMMETAGPPPVEVQTQRALLGFYQRAGRIEDLLALWPLLRATGAVTLPLAAARRECERSFDALQTHAVAAHVEAWTKRAQELARVAGILLPAWPEELSMGEALRAFRHACEGLDLEPPEGWGALDAFAARDAEPHPVAVIVAALESFLPAQQPAAGAASRAAFARVTLTTRRRAEGLAWSHVIFVESNAGVWPERREPSCWLTDEQRAMLNERSGDVLGLFTSEDRAVLERAAYAAIARDTRQEIIFSTALFAPEEPELRLAPNSWLERVIWAQGLAGEGADLEAILEEAARAAPRAASADERSVRDWHAVWIGRRDAGRRFDEFFFAGDPARISPAKLPARLIERGVQDPAELWFEAVLGVRRVEWEPFVRARRKALGQRAHELLADALYPADATPGGFGEMPGEAEATVRLEAGLAALRARWPRDRYWDSFHAELAHVCRALLKNAYTIEAGQYVAAEAWLPQEAHLMLGATQLRVVGRLDLVRLDRPAWKGAEIDIIDFKTGGDTGLSAERMGRSGASLQLGVYLQAARSIGAEGGKVWMIKPEPGAVTQLGYDDMLVALAKLRWLERAITGGVYGALTRDRSDYAPAGCAWPLACTPVPAAILERKFALTFDMNAGETLE